MAQTRQVPIFEMLPITMQELMVLPNLSREQYMAEIRYRGNDIKSFRDIALADGRKRYNLITRKNADTTDGSQETFREKMFKENCGEWLILDNPILAVANKYTYIPADGKKYDSNDPFTPVAIMNVTLNGDNAYTVYLPLGECCRSSENSSNHYYIGGFAWEERPFEKIMNMLRKGKKIGYTFYDREDEIEWRFRVGGGFRFFDT